MNCAICSCEHQENVLIRTGLLNLHGSEDDYICNRCKLEISHFVHSLMAVAHKVRYEEKENAKRIKVDYE